MIIRLENHCPIAQKRHRTGKWGMYDPSSSDKEDVMILIRSKNKLEFLGEGPLKASFKFLFPIPMSLSKKKKDLLAGEPHIKRPDIDNCLKFYIDTMQDMGLFKDDSQICELNVIKIYSSIPRVEINIKKI